MKSQSVLYTECCLGYHEKPPTIKKLLATNRFFETMGNLCWLKRNLCLFYNRKNPIFSPFIWFFNNWYKLILTPFIVQNFFLFSDICMSSRISEKLVNFFFIFFYVPCRSRMWMIMSLRNFLFFVTLGNLTIPNLCSPIRLHKIIS